MQYYFLYYQQVSSFFSTFFHAKLFVFDNISMISLVFSNQLLPGLLFNF